MIEIVREYVELFVATAGLTEELDRYLPLGGIAVIVLGVSACLFGFRIYRALFAVMVFSGISIGFSYLLTEMPWCDVSAWIAVLGCVVAFMGYFWYRIGGLCVCALIGCCLGWVLHPSYLVVALMGLLVGVAQIFFPVITITAMTSLWGTYLLREGLDWQFAQSLIGMMSIAILSFVIQMRMNTKQKLFAKTIPDGLRFWIESKRK